MSCRNVLSLLIGSCLLIPFLCFPEIIDRIVAVVNEQVITLTDLRIAEAFGLYDEELKEGDGSLRPLILEKLIDQKLAIQFSSQEVSIDKKDFDFFMGSIVKKIGFEEVQERLAEFGLERDDLRDYIQEKFIYQTIISRKFSQVSIVSLKEIEDYYKQIYVPSQREKGLEPQPMMELLNEIESAIKEKKMKVQVEDWIKNLRKKADIQIKKL